jgi:predicted Zn finger-like uncharacterized protein
MILTCPACATRYLTDPALLGATGRVVRCAKCQHSWLQVPPADMPQRLDVPIPPRMTPPGIHGGLPARVTEKRPARLGWLVFLFLLIGVLAGSAYLFRQQLAAQVPQMAGLLAVFDGAPLGAGLEFSNISFVRRDVDGQNAIVIEGQVFNTTPEIQAVPTLKATLRNEQGQWLHDWTFSLDQATLEPGETARFKTTATNPPAATKKLLVTFTDAPPAS